jgi:hypothetical protein
LFDDRPYKARQFARDRGRDPALPKNMADYRKKFVDRAFYRANAEWFLLEMDHIVASVPRESSQPDATFAYGNVLRFVQHLLIDSVVIFAHWGTRCAEVPRDYGIGKNEMTHLVLLFHGSRQIIYGHGSFGLSFVENHSDIAVGTIRQVELRLRRAFGLLGKAPARGSGRRRQRGFFFRDGNRGSASIR